jgi:hypothetical protein
MHLKSLLILTFLLVASTLASAQSSKLLAEKDLAIALPMSFRELPRDSLFPRVWFKELSKGFSQTNVGSALETESIYEDWQLVSLRIAVCEALGHTPAEADQKCWPEVRLVWQPVQRKIRLHERYMEYAGDDRAVHAIYPVLPDRFLNADSAARIQTHIQTLKQGQPLNAAAKQEFQVAREKVLRELLIAVRSLRDPSLPNSAFAGLGIRPEADDTLMKKSFAQRLAAFLNRWTPPADLRLLTAFSLPEGREPAHLDEWVFLAFRAEKGVLTKESIKIRSAADGRVLADMGPSIRGSMGRDDDSLYDLLNGSNDGEELAASVILQSEDISRLTPKVQDRERLLVGNTSCISCHKLNDLRFDFHNFSYLEDRDITISPRVKRDVELDLIWLQKQNW